jgi:hypothetical protein
MRVERRVATDSEPGGEGTRDQGGEPMNGLQNEKGRDARTPQPAPTRENARVRCVCRDCGAHVHAVKGMSLYGQCSNCGSVDLVPLEP